MKITSQDALPIGLSADRTSAQRLRPGKSSTAKKTDEVSISQAAKNLAGAGYSTVDLARQEKIAALKRSIENGTYRAEPEKVAKSLLAEITASNKISEKL